MNTQKMQQLVEQKLLRRNQKEVSFDETPERGKEDVYLDFDTIDALDILNEKERAVIVLAILKIGSFRKLQMYWKKTSIPPKVFCTAALEN